MVYAFKQIYMGDVHNVDDHLKACREASLNYAENYHDLMKMCGGSFHRHPNGNGYYRRAGNWEYQAVKTTFKTLRQAPCPAA